jgi:hypothetical protein
MSPERKGKSRSEESCGPRGCPVGEVIDLIFNLPGERLSHFRQAKIEFWRGIRDLIDQRIDWLENAGQRRKGRVRKVDVE